MKTMIKTGFLFFSLILFSETTHAGIKRGYLVFTKSDSALTQTLKKNPNCQVLHTASLGLYSFASLCYRTADSPQVQQFGPYQRPIIIGLLAVGTVAWLTAHADDLQKIGPTIVKLDESLRRLPNKFWTPIQSAFQHKRIAVVHHDAQSGAPGDSVKTTPKVGTPGVLSQPSDEAKPEPRKRTKAEMAREIRERSQATHRDKRKRELPKKLSDTVLDSETEQALAERIKAGDIQELRLLDGMIERKVAPQVIRDEFGIIVQDREAAIREILGHIEGADPEHIEVVIEGLRSCDGGVISNQTLNQIETLVRDGSIESLVEIGDYFEIDYEPENGDGPEESDLENF